MTATNMWGSDLLTLPLHLPFLSLSRCLLFCFSAEGYYRYRLGDLLEGGRYRVCGLQGSGVFSTVLRVRELLPGTNGAPSTEGRELVVKLIRSNETMYKAGQKELEYLKLLAANDPDNKKHVVHLLANFMHRNHLCLVFEPLNMDLRKVRKSMRSSQPQLDDRSLTQPHAQLTFHASLIHNSLSNLFDVDPSVAVCALLR